MELWASPCSRHRLTNAWTVLQAGEPTGIRPSLDAPVRGTVQRIKQLEMAVVFGLSLSAFQLASVGSPRHASGATIRRAQRCMIAWTEPGGESHQWCGVVVSEVAGDQPRRDAEHRKIAADGDRLAHRHIPASSIQVPMTPTSGAPTMISTSPVKKLIHAPS